MLSKFTVFLVVFFMHESYLFFPIPVKKASKAAKTTFLFHPPQFLTKLHSCPNLRTPSAWCQLLSVICQAASIHHASGWSPNASHAIHEHCELAQRKPEPSPHFQAVVLRELDSEM